MFLMHIDNNNKYYVPKKLVCLNTNVTNAHHVVLWQFFARSFVGKILSYNTIEDRCCR